MKESPISMDEGLSSALCPMSAPTALREVLLKEARRVDRPHRSLRNMALAASFLLGAVALGWVFKPAPDPAMDFAQLAVRNHTTVTRMDFVGGPPDGEAGCGMWCMEKLGYQAPLPRQVDASQVVGGRACSIQSRPVAYYQLASGGGLYVFKEPVKELAKRCPCSLTLPDGYTARMWNEAERGYLLVEAAGSRR